MSIDALRKTLNKANSELSAYIQPLNNRLKAHNMNIWMDGYGNFYINRHSSVDKCGFSIYLNDEHYEKLMALTDEELIKKVMEW